MTSYNPQIKLEINEILEDGADVPFNVDFLGGSDTSHSDTNKPLQINCTINNSLGSSQNTCAITITNSLYLEEFRRDPQAQLEKIKGKKLRVRCWGYFDDNNQTASTAMPFVQPAFVGDALEGFDITSSGVNDANLTINAQGHAWLATSGKYRKTWEIGQNYLEIVDEIMGEITFNRGQGQELSTDRPWFIIDDFDLKLEEKELESPLTVNRNPIETLNDICRDLDMVWGVHNNIPYILSRDRASQSDKFLIGLNNQGLENKAVVNYETGLLSIIDYGTDGFSFTHNYDRNLFIGRVVEVSDEPQTGERDTFIAGRIRSVSTTLDNYTGNTMTVQCDYLTDYNPGRPLQAKVVLPERRADNSGLRSK